MAGLREPPRREHRDACKTGLGNPVWFYLTLLALVTVLATRAWAAGDPERGHTLAKTWCTGCHTVDANGPAKDTAPSFASIAARNEPDRSRSFISAPHPPMPNFNLARDQIDDIVAYLASLAPRR
jgi:mono/diheme cytochrome c family protein